MYISRSRSMKKETIPGTRAGPRGTLGTVTLTTLSPTNSRTHSRPRMGVISRRRYRAGGRALN
ncbi:hypothetical protein BSIN_0577 [Burkholderia singularis]|uniref:Uncharacterized protein n=1 Tax=Burkholderia singularis TaxID=1503053 RepID=A0A238H7E2_9BURK|nr:hypothetical protein BSIN_0577 [Burkholderia singularis]